MTLFPSLLCTILAIFGPSAAGQGATSDEAAPATIVPTPAVVDFGDVFDGEILKQTVVFKNAGAADWPVQQVRTSCGCTVARLKGPDGAEIPNVPRPGQALVTLGPGEEFEVGVEFSTANQHGSVEKSVQLFHLDPQVASLSIPVRARVTKALTISPSVLTMGSIGKRETIEKTVVLESSDIGEWTIEGFESAIETMPLPEFLGFDVSNDTDNRKIITVKLEGSRPVGTVSAKVRVLIGHERVNFTEFFLSGVVESDVTFDSGNPSLPKIISFDQVQPDTTTTRTMVVRNTDPSTPYNLTGFDLFTEKPEFFEVDIRTVEAGMHYEVDVTVNSDIDMRFFRGTLVLQADHPDLPEKPVPFHGWVPKK